MKCSLGVEARQVPQGLLQKEAASQRWGREIYRLWPPAMGVRLKPERPMEAGRLMERFPGNELPMDAGRFIGRFAALGRPMDEPAPNERPAEVGPLIERFAAYDLLGPEGWLLPKDRPPFAAVRFPAKERPAAVEWPPIVERAFEP